MVVRIGGYKHLGGHVRHIPRVLDHDLDGHPFCVHVGEPVDSEPVCVTLGHDAPAQVGRRDEYVVLRLRIDRLQDLAYSQGWYGPTLRRQT